VADEARAQGEPAGAAVVGDVRRVDVEQRQVGGVEAITGGHGAPL
jgi:hypothetical protein